MSDPEILRLTFSDLGALERQITTNIRYGRLFVKEILELPVLTEGMIVLVHPVHGRELQLPAQIVMVNLDGPMQGTGIALRGFGPSEVEQVEAFARALPQPSAADPDAVPPLTGGRRGEAPSPRAAAPVATPQRARTASSVANPAQRQATGARTDPRARTASGVANTAVQRPAQEINAASPGARSAGSVGNPAAQRPAQEREQSDFERDRTGSGPQPTAARARATSRAVAPAFRQPAQAIHRSAGDRERSGSDPQPTAARAPRANSVAQQPVRAEEDWSDFEHGPDPQAEPNPQPKAADTNAASGATRAAPTEPAPAAANDDGPGFEHQPESPPPTAPRIDARTDGGDANRGRDPTSASSVTRVAAKQSAPTAEEDDWSDFEHGPECDTSAQPQPATRAAEPNAQAVQPSAADHLTIPPGASDEPLQPSAAFATDPHGAVTQRPPGPAATAGSDPDAARADTNSLAVDDALDPLDNAAGSPEFDEDPGLDPSHTSHETQSNSRQARLRSLNVVEQLKLARRGELQDRVAMERLYGKTVWEALLQNPRISLPEVARIARKGTVPRPLLETILDNASWLKDSNVRRALLSHPKLTSEGVLKLLRLTPKHELKIMEKGTAYPMPVRDAARKLLRE